MSNNSISEKGLMSLAVKACFFVLAVFLLTVPKVYSAFTNVSKTTFTAVATSTSAGRVSVSLQLKNLSDNTAATQVYWSTSSITPGVTGWRRSDAYILIHSTITAGTGGIQIYTDNKAADANPQFPAADAGDPCGLLDTSSTTLKLPMCWRVTDVSTTTLTIVETGGLPNYLYSAELGASYYCFIHMKDKNTPGVNPGDSYITAKEAISGTQHAENTWSYNMVSPNYIYLGANFSGAKYGRTYKTSTLRIEAFTE